MSLAIFNASQIGACRFWKSLLSRLCWWRLVNTHWNKTEGSRWNRYEKQEQAALKNVERPGIHILAILSSSRSFTRTTTHSHTVSASLCLLPNVSASVRERRGEEEPRRKGVCEWAAGVQMWWGLHGNGLSITILYNTPPPPHSACLKCCSKIYFSCPAGRRGKVKSSPHFYGVCASVALRFPVLHRWTFWTAGWGKGSEWLEHIHNASPFLSLPTPAHVHTNAHIGEETHSRLFSRAIKVEWLEQSSTECIQILMHQ